MSNIIHAAESRHSVKAYTPSEIPADQVAQIKRLLQLAPSSINSQPWHFVLAGTPEGRARVAKAAHGHYAYNAASITDASHVVVFASRLEMTDAYIHHFIDQEDRDGRFLAPANKEQRLKTSLFFADEHRVKANDARAWMTNQLYINLGSFLLGVASLGIDATPMEGIDTTILDQEFGLTEKGFQSHLIVTLGKRDEEKDFNAKLPKSRLPLEEIIEEV